MSLQRIQSSLFSVGCHAVTIAIITVVVKTTTASLLLFVYKLWENNFANLGDGRSCRFRLPS